MADDVAKWTDDGQLSKQERIEIFEACGRVKCSYGWFGIRIPHLWDGDCWSYSGDEDYDLSSLSREDLATFIASYRN